MTSNDSLQKQMADHLKKYPSHTLSIKSFKGMEILICKECGATWQSFAKDSDPPA